MFTVILKPGLRFKKDNKVYQILKLLPNQLVETLDESFGDSIIFTQQELISSLSNGNLHFEAKGKNVKKSYDHTINTNYEFNDIQDIKHKEKAIFKFRVIQPLLDIPNRKESDIKKRVEQINTLVQNPKVAKEVLKCDYFKKVSRTTIYRWIREYEEGNKDFRSLVPSYHNCGGKGRSRLPNIIIDFINQFIKEKYLNKQRITKKDTWLFIVDKIVEYNETSNNKLTIPSYSTVVRYIDKVPEFELVSKRYSKRDAEKKFGSVNSGVKVNYPLERVEIDTKTIDIIIVGEDGNVIGRPNLIAAIDKFSRQILGFHISFGKPGWQDVMQCMRHIMSDKSYVKLKYPNIKNTWTAFGVPKTIVVDNGKEFKNKAMEDACLQLGIIIEYCPPRVPEWKGSIERFFGTYDSNLVHNFPGTTRSNPQKLAEGEKPSKLACLTLTKFTELIHKWIIDVYSQNLNRGAKGIPAKIWDKYVSQHPVAWPNSISELAIALGKVTKRKIRKTGIQLNNITYNSFELHKLFLNFSKKNNGENEYFKIKYNPLDISRIFVYDHLISKNWIEVPSTCPEYTNNLSEWEHLECCKRIRNEVGRVDIVSLAKAKIEIYKEIEKGIKYSRTRKAKVKRIDSSTDIFNDKKVNSPINPESTDFQIDKIADNFNLLDLGTCYEHSNESNSIIITQKNIQNNSQNINIKLNIKHNIEPEFISDNELEGFNIIVNGDEFDG